MDAMDAWQYIFNNWTCSTWQAIPEQVKQSLHFASNLGMYSGTLVTKTGSIGMSEYIYRMNHKQEGTK